jgi:hypothetical protein
MVIRDFDMAPAFERCKHHEEVGGAVALVLVIATDRPPRFIGMGTRVSPMSCFEVSCVRPIVLSLARSTMWSSTTLFSNNRKVQHARPLGGLEQAKVAAQPHDIFTEIPLRSRDFPRSTMWRPKRITKSFQFG